MGVLLGLMGVGTSLVWMISAQKSSIGARTPGQAVERFLAALDRGDAVGVAQNLRVAEGRLFTPGVEQLVRQLGRFRSSGDSTMAPGVSLAKPRWRVAFVSSQEESGVGKRATVKVLPSEIALPGDSRGDGGAPGGSPGDNGDAGGRSDDARDVGGGWLGRILNGGGVGGWFRHFLSATGQTNDPSLVLATVRSQGRWYVSFASTAEYAWNRLAARKPSTPLPRAGMPTKPDESGLGADSAEKAVQTWLDAVVDLDYQTVRALTNPVEAEAFPADAIGAVWGQRIDKLRRQFELVVPDAAGQMFRRQTRSGTQVVVSVTIRDATLALTEPGAEPFVAQYHEGCLVILSGGKATKHCGRQIPRFGDQFSIPVEKATIDRFVGRLDALADARKALPGIVAVQHDGTWFVSPTQSLLLNLGEGLSRAKRADIAALASDVQNAISSDG